MLNIDDLLEKYPILDLGGRVGFTHYIDFIKWKDVKYPIMVGKDAHRRFFIVLKLLVGNKKILQTFFQRYPDDSVTDLRKCLVMGAGHATPLLFETSGGMPQSQFDILELLLDKEWAVLKDEHRVDYYFNNYIGQKVLIYDIKKERASRIIKEAWAKCRWDPQYKMCWKIMLEKQKEIEENHNHRLIY